MAKQKEQKTWVEGFREQVKKEGLNLVQQFKLLTIRKKKLEALLEEVSEMLSTAEEAIFAEWEAEGIATVKLDTGETFYTHAQYWAKRLPVYKTDKNGKIVMKNGEPVPLTDKESGEVIYHTAEDVIDALKASGLSDLVKEGYNAQTLSGVVREWKKKGEEMPEPLAKVLTAEPTYSVRIRGLKVMSETKLEDDVY